MILTSIIFLISFIISSAVSIAIIEFIYSRYLATKINHIIDVAFINIYRGNTYNTEDISSLYKESKHLLYMTIWFILLFFVDLIVSTSIIGLFILNLYLFF